MAEATAAPSSDDIPQGKRSVAPAKGIGERRARLTWQKELVAHLDRQPANRALDLDSGEILVGFVLDRMGHVLSANIVKGSGDSVFDDAALAMDAIPIRFRSPRRLSRMRA